MNQEVLETNTFFPPTSWIFDRLKSDNFTANHLIRMLYLKEKNWTMQICAIHCQSLDCHNNIYSHKTIEIKIITQIVHCSVKNFGGHVPPKSCSK